MKKIKVGAVSYLNTKPLVYGIKRSEVLQQIDLFEDYPSKIAAMLLNDEIDVGLVPVAIIPKLNEHYIITDYCIGAEGPVASVCIFSEVPMEEITSVLLDYQSRTSVALAKILLCKHWKKDVEYIQATGENYISEIKGTTAGVVIGDRALQQQSVARYVYDLGEAWRDYTGLPFVFAAWVANKKLPDEFIKAFNEANTIGLRNIEKVIEDIGFTSFDLKTYYTANVSYYLDDQKREGLNKFLSLLRSNAQCTR